MGNYFEDERTKKYAYGCVVLVVGFIIACIFLKAYKQKYLVNKNEKSVCKF